MTTSSNSAAIAGAVSGLTARLASTPLDVIKIRFQLQLEPIRINNININNVIKYDPKYRGVLQAVRKITVEEGLVALWKGTVPGLLMYAIFGSVQFTAYEKTKQILTHNFNLHNKVVRDFVGGCVGGCIASSIVHPLDVIRTRLVGQGEPKYYKTFRKAVGLMYKEKGIRTFYRGLVPALLVITPQAGMQFGFYSLYTYIWRSNFINEETAAGTKNIDKSLNGHARLICGALAGVTSKSIALPLDTVKKRLEVQGFEKARSQFGRISSYNGLNDVFVKIWREEGLSGFYKGILPGLLKASLTVSISFYIYGYTVHLLS